MKITRLEAKIARLTIEAMEMEAMGFSAKRVREVIDELREEARQTEKEEEQWPVFTL